MKVNGRCALRSSKIPARRFCNLPRDIGYKDAHVTDYKAITVSAYAWSSCPRNLKLSIIRIFVSVPLSVFRDVQQLFQSGQLISWERQATRYRRSEDQDDFTFSAHENNGIGN
ncbi:hypothetical protein RvY_03053 [Ramazzottius varieornatus]|uniref:Uncharacterized protein n=1 Tax=Ramazzottius varieornatus TaxID=947166 RepID=A0A1D1UTT9_RAMVA|nr:hypothetical protein RvY_03053 [Ramazzottius varieornatus]